MPLYNTVQGLEPDSSTLSITGHMKLLSASAKRQANGGSRGTQRVNNCFQLRAIQSVLIIQFPPFDQSPVAARHFSLNAHVCIYGLLFLESYRWRCNIFVQMQEKYREAVDVVVFATSQFQQQQLHSSILHCHMRCRSTLPTPA